MIKDNSDILSNYNFITKYAQIKEDGTKESWEEAVDRIWDMHEIKYKKKLANNEKLQRLFDFARNAEKEKRFLSAQRFRQFASTNRNKGIFKHNSKAYNCASTYIDRQEVFSEIMYMLLSGAGVGFSVQKVHIQKLPEIHEPSNKIYKYIIDDSIEGWSNAIRELTSSYFKKNGETVVFDYSKIRLKGSLIADQFIAPGPDGLRNSIEKIRQILDNAVKYGSRKLKSIEIYDIIMWEADAVLSGGLRRSATICLTDSSDEDIINAKTGNWWKDNPQRGLSNNTILLNRKTDTKETFYNIFEKTKSMGEPGFGFTDHYNVMYNPCFEIGMIPITEKGISGWSVCNLTEINGKKANTLEDLLIAAKAAAIAGTIQAGYTGFKYINKASKEIIERDALIGVSITGWMNNPDILFDIHHLKQAADTILDTNALVAEMIGINQAKRTTTTKPSGNASILLKTSSGIHGEHYPRYIRNIQVNKTEVGYYVMKEVNPFSLEDKTNKDIDAVISFAIKPKDGSIYKHNLIGTKQLEYVKKAQKYWVEAGNREDELFGIKVRHNISNTIQVTDDEWDNVRDYIWENRNYFSGVSLLGINGELDYAQAPFQSVKSEQELLDEYGDGVFFASGLIVDGIGVFKHLWNGIDAALYNEDLDTKGEDSLIIKISKERKKDWIRRLRKFAKNYFDGDLKKASYCLKDVYLRHKYNKLKNEMVEIDWSNIDFNSERYQNAANIEAACAGGTCEINL